MYIQSTEANQGKL